MRDDYDAAVPVPVTDLMQARSVIGLLERLVHKGAMERMHQGTMPVLLLWTYEELDEALARDGWSRVGEWRYGPSADVQRID